MQAAYYNEIDPTAAAWLRNLIAAGEIAPGVVDERSIADVRLSDLAAFSQCHFFAGIGGWSKAARLAGWPDDRPLWTGSCPCQPFSAAGKREGFADERHLWPVWFNLIRECRPSIVFGEQVEKAIKWGWLDLVCSELERQGYACAAAVLPACSVGAPHKRDRVWFVADSNGGNAGAERLQRSGEHRQFAANCRAGKSVDDATSARRFGTIEQSERETRNETRLRLSSAGSEVGELANAQRHAAESGRFAIQSAESVRAPTTRSHAESGRCSMLGDSWRNTEWLPCIDGKSRPVESGTFPLAHGIPGRVGRLRGYGNAIVPQVAAEFISAYLDC